MPSKVLSKLKEANFLTMFSEISRANHIFILNQVADLQFLWDCMQYRADGATVVTFLLFLGLGGTIVFYGRQE